jgi:P4 family phage/plasmid primase-like protien
MGDRLRHMERNAIMDSRDFDKKKSTNDDWLEGGPLDDDSWLEKGLAAFRPWPRPLVYEHHHGAKNAALFLGQRKPRRIISSDGTLYSLGDDGLWHELPKTDLEAEIRATDPARFLDVHDIDKMVRAIHHETAAKCRPFQWLKPRAGDPTPSDLILFRNGRFNFRTKELVPHDGRYFATAAPVFDYDPDATCPLWDRCMREWLPESYHNTIHEFAGYTMTADTRLEKMLVLVGTGRSGKSTVARVLSWLCGTAHAVSRSLAELGGDFGLEGTLDKRLMLIPDAHDCEVRQRSVVLARIKGIVGNDELSINGKNVKIASANVPVRIIMVANRHPSFIDESGALSLRELLIHFGNSFVGREDRNLSTKLRRELSGIANRALAGLTRLRASRNTFTVGKDMEAATLELRRLQSPALDFVMSKLILTRNDDHFCPDYRLYELYGDFCKENGIGGRLRRTLANLKTDIVAALGKGVRATQRRVKIDRYGYAMNSSSPSHGLAGLKAPREPLPDGVTRLAQPVKD